MRRRRRHAHRKATAGELDAAAAITPADVERARLAWRRLAGGSVRKILDARKAAEPAPVTPRGRRAR